MSTEVRSVGRLHWKRRGLLSRLAEKYGVPDDVVFAWYGEDQQALQTKSTAEIENLIQFLWVEWFDNQEGRRCAT